MCTVSYIPKTNNNGFLLTSNRDEKEFRKTIEPEIYNTGNAKICYPKDTKAGGSWIAINDKGRLCCLLNGALKSHKKENFHIVSRGKILLELTSTAQTFKNYFENRDLSNVEPFTIIALQQQNGMPGSFGELIWDGNTKHFNVLDEKKHYIWSSATLYSEENRQMRKTWFYDFLISNANNLSKDVVLDFHSGNHTDDDSINIVMERENGLKTVSITQVVSESGKLQLSYNDLLNDTKSIVEL